MREIVLCPSDGGLPSDIFLLEVLPLTRDHSSTPMTAQPSLREFFEQELGSTRGNIRELGFDDEVSTQHLVSHLTEQTVRRAALDAATHRHAPERIPERAPTEGSWKHHVMVAALTELRPVKLLARN